MRNIAYFLLFIFFMQFVKAQNNDRQAATYNILSNAVLGGIGAVINKKREEKFHKVLFKGMGQGALGGYLTFESKRLVREFSETENYAYLWPSKVLNATGNSVTYNAASNRNFWERWNMDFGFSYLEIDLKRKRRFRYRILPFALYGNIDGFVNAKFDLKRTLYSGHFIFRNNNIRQIQDFQPLGFALVNTIQFDPSFGINIEETIAHEIIHVYQYTGYFPVNAILKKPITRLDQKSNFFKSYHKIFMTDFNIILHSGITKVQDIFGVEYENRFVEREARYYSERTF